MKKILLSLALIGASSSLFAQGAEHAYLYKDSRIMGMGGANVAVGSYSTSIFSNPAGLASIKKDHGFVVDILGLGVSGSGSTAEFVDDLSDASDSDDNSAMTDLLNDNMGTPYHIGIDNYTAISKNSDAFAWSVGLLVASDTNFITHAPLALEVATRAYGGVLVGVAKPFDTEYGKLDVGIGLKMIKQSSYENSFTVDDLMDEDVTDTMEDDLQDSTGFGLDIGVVYYPQIINEWNPKLGLSIMNIGAMDMDDNFGQQPMTVNLGASVSPEVPFIDRLVFAVDYVDIFSANEARVWDQVDGTYEDLSESDFMKRLRLGVGLGLIDTSFFHATLNLGMYQSAYTAGVQMELLMLKLSVATYEEEVGTGSASNTDRRYMANIGLGW